MDSRTRVLTISHVEFASGFRNDLDALAEGWTKQLGGIEDQPVHVGRLRLQRLLTGEGKQLPNEVGATPCGFVDHPRNRCKLRRMSDRVGEDLDGPGDDGKDVVEVVSDAAGEVTDRVELLGLAQLLL